MYVHIHIMFKICVTYSLLASSPVAVHVMFVCNVEESPYENKTSHYSPTPNTGLVMANMM